MTNAKYLGVHISSDLSWTFHITQTVNKANRTLGFLRRVLNISSVKTKSKAFNTLVRPQLEYAAAVWDPHTKADIHRLDMVQRRGARYVCNKFHRRDSITKILDKLNWPPLAQRRETARLSTLYKIAAGDTLIDPSERLLPLARRSRHYNSRSFLIPSCRTDVLKYSFFPRTIAEWNRLPEAAMEAEGLEGFKAFIKT